VKVSGIYVYFPLQGSKLKNASFHMGEAIFMAGTVHQGVD
jgi:hypothetical protein